jgi:Na+(H+)/acetate symporter ActP
MESMIPNIADFADAVKFNGYSWAVIVVYMILTTWLGHRLSGSHATIRDFFLGGRKIPWYAVSGSVIATELSAMTLVGAPAFLWAASGDMSYAVLAIGTILGRIIVGYVFVPKYYEQEIYSPYEYIGNQLGHRANRITSFLFMMGGILGQGTRVLLTAIVLEVVTGMDIYACIWIVGFVSVVWTWMGGITTVIWTDVIQFLVFAFSSILTLVIVGMEFHTVDGQAGVGVIVDLASGEIQRLQLGIRSAPELYGLGRGHRLYHRQPGGLWYRSDDGAAVLLLQGSPGSPARHHLVERQPGPHVDLPSDGGGTVGLLPEERPARHAQRLGTSSD